jgi:hypothetical protein
MAKWGWADYSEAAPAEYCEYHNNGGQWELGAAFHGHGLNGDSVEDGGYNQRHWAEHENDVVVDGVNYRVCAASHNSFHHSHKTSPPEDTPTSA